MPKKKIIIALFVIGVVLFICLINWAVNAGHAFLVGLLIPPVTVAGLIKLTKDRYYQIHCCETQFRANLIKEMKFQAEIFSALLLVGLAASFAMGYYKLDAINKDANYKIYQASVNSIQQVFEEADYKNKAYIQDTHVQLNKIFDQLSSAIIAGDNNKININVSAVQNQINSVRAIMANDKMERLDKAAGKLRSIVFADKRFETLYTVTALGLSLLISLQAASRKLAVAAFDASSFAANKNATLARRIQMWIYSFFIKTAA